MNNRVVVSGKYYFIFREEDGDHEIIIIEADTLHELYQELVKWTTWNDLDDQEEGIHEPYYNGWGTMQRFIQFGDIIQGETVSNRELIKICDALQEES